MIDTSARNKRWPRSVYGSGAEPDYRFSFANERTYLAWLRTSLALLAAGVALDAVDLSMSPRLQRYLAAALAVLSLFGAIAAWVRWARAERAMRRCQQLPSFGLGLLLSGCTIVLAGIVAVVAFVP